MFLAISLANSMYNDMFVCSPQSKHGRRRRMRARRSKENKWKERNKSPEQIIFMQWQLELIAVLTLDGKYDKQRARTLCLHINSNIQSEIYCVMRPYFCVFSLCVCVCTLDTSNQLHFDGCILFSLYGTVCDAVVIHTYILFRWLCWFLYTAFSTTLSSRLRTLFQSPISCIGWASISFNLFTAKFTCLFSSPHYHFDAIEPYCMWFIVSGDSFSLSFPHPKHRELLCLC